MMIDESLNMELLFSQSVNNTPLKQVYELLELMG